MKDSDIKLRTKVWIMEANKPLEIEIRSITSEAHSNYETYHYYKYGGGRVELDDMFKTKGMLMDSVFNVSEMLSIGES